MSDSHGQIAQFGAHLVKDAQWQPSPEVVSWWPETIFWSVLFYCSLLLLLVFLARQVYQWLRRTYIRQTALFFAEYDAQNDLPNIATLMRQFAQQHWPKETLERLSASEFAKRIVAISPNDCIAVKSIESLLTISYQANGELPESDRTAIRAWFKAVTC